MVKIEADLSAVVWKVLVAPGDRIEEGDEIAILESMKMEIPVEVPVGGVVEQLFVGEGDAVSPGSLIATIS